MDYPARRRRRLARTLREESLGALLITNPVNVTYLTGFTGEASWLVVSRQRTVLVSDSRFTTQIEEECPGLEASIRPPSRTLYQAAALVLKKLAVSAVGFESGHVTVADHETLRELLPAVSWSGKRDRVETLRARKDPSEVRQIREAIAIAERAFVMFRAMLRPDDREKDLADRLEDLVRRSGGCSTSFPSIVAVGARAAMPHAPPTNCRVEDGGLLLLDWGARGAYYNSDLTRVVATRKISPKLERVYKVVLTAQERAIRAIRPGIPARDVDAEARRVIAQAGFGKFFGHGLGHGIGLEVHEAPALRQNSNAVLEAGMVVTVEPGIYLPGWGGVRIEDDVLVTPDGHEVLTSLPNALELLELESR
jgi:Xaa-Pro aminopeptidase